VEAHTQSEPGREVAPRPSYRPEGRGKGPSSQRPKGRTTSPGKGGFVDVVRLEIIVVLSRSRGTSMNQDDESATENSIRIVSRALDRKEHLPILDIRLKGRRVEKGERRKST